MLFYNPGCAHCSAALRPFVQLAEQLRRMGAADAVTVARFDVEAHPPPEHVHFHGVPTLMLFPATTSSTTTGTTVSEPRGRFPPCRCPVPLSCAVDGSRVLVWMVW